MTRGVYRRVYSGFLRGRRINAVSWAAEAWFWRLHALADDYGNLHGSARSLAVEAAPRREVSVKEAAALTDELVTVGLLQRYTDQGDDYLHIVGFTTLQPAGRNGRRIKRVPHDPGESGGIQGNPLPPIPIPIPIPNPRTNGGRAVSAAKPADPAGRLWGNPRYGLQFDPEAVRFVWVRADMAEFVARWKAAYPATDPNTEVLRAAEWCAANPERGKKSNYRKFLTDWMSRTQDQGGTRNGLQPHIISNADRRRAEKRASEFAEPEAPIPAFRLPSKSQG